MGKSHKLIESQSDLKFLQKKYLKPLVKSQIPIFHNGDIADDLNHPQSPIFLRFGSSIISVV